jgi:hypothetical protein
MPRHNQRVALRVRYRLPGKRFNTHFVLTGDPTKGVEGRQLKVGKVGYEEVLKVGEFWKPFRDQDAESVALRRLVDKPIKREVAVSA